MIQLAASLVRSRLSIQKQTPKGMSPKSRAHRACTNNQLAHLSLFSKNRDMFGILEYSGPPTVAWSSCCYRFAWRFDVLLLRFIRRSMRFIAARLCSSDGWTYL